MSDAAKLARQLESPDPETRRLAVKDLPGVDGALAADLLVIALGDEDWRVRKEAAQLAPMLARREDALRALGRALDDKTNVGLRNAAVEALIAMGPDAVPTAAEALRRLDADGRKLAAEVLGGVPDVRGARALAACLKDADPNVRYAAAEALGTAAVSGDEVRREAIKGLSHALVHGEPVMKLAALDALLHLDAPLPWRLLEPLCADPMVRRRAIGAAARCAEDAAGLALAEAIFDPSAPIARHALVALAEWVDAAWCAGRPLDAVRARLQSHADAAERVRAMGHAQGPALVALAAIGHPADAPAVVEAALSPDLGPSAELALGMLGSAAVPAVLQAAKGAPPERRAALFALLTTLTGALTSEALDAVRAALAEDPDVAASAARTLGSLGDGSDLDRVAPLVTHPDIRAASAAVAALARLAERHPQEARAALTRFAADDARAAAGCVLIAATPPPGPLAERDLAFLRRALAASDVRVRRAALEAIASRGGDAAREHVTMALADEEREVRLAAVRALGRLGHTDALETLLGSAADAELVAAACRALGDADPERCVHVVASLVRSPDAAVACAAVEAVGQLSVPRARDVLIAALDHGDPEVVRLALSEISRVGDARTLSRLGMCLDHQAWEVRRLAAELLGQDASKEARALLRARLERETDAVVREAILVALSGSQSFSGMQQVE